MAKVKTPRFRRPLAIAFAIAALAACAPSAPAPKAATGGPSPESGALASADPVFYPARLRSELPPAVIPKRPAVSPGYAQYDEASGLHVTGEPLELDLNSWRLTVTGSVLKPLSLDFDEVRMLPGVRSRSTLVCPGYFEDSAVWAGASLIALLELAQPLPGAKGITLISADGYSTWLDMEDALSPQNFLAYEFGEGQPVPVLHGFPLRAVLPSLTGSKWAKWLVEIEVRGSDPPE